MKSNASFLTWRYDVATFFRLQLSSKQKSACVDSWKSTITKPL
jgi:hypothetical protein